MKAFMKNKRPLEQKQVLPAHLLHGRLGDLRAQEVCLQLEQEGRASHTCEGILVILIMVIIACK